MVMRAIEPAVDENLVGYGAHPNEVTGRIRMEAIPTIMGNYDDGVGFERDECGSAYTNSVDERGPVRRDGTRVLLVHGSPRRMNEYLFEDRRLSSFQRLAASSNADIIVFGQTHKPYTTLVNDVLFVNAGSVGKPKDDDWRSDP